MPSGPRGSSARLAHRGKRAKRKSETTPGRRACLALVLIGVILSGLGFALFEERVLDESLGLPLNPTMHDYKIPTLTDLPAIDAFFVSGADTVANHTGAKGLAEPPIIGMAPAIANAVADAIGVEIMELPLTPWRVLAALEAQTGT